MTILDCVIQKVFLISHPVYAKKYEDGKERKQSSGYTGVHRAQGKWKAWHIALHYDQES